MAQNNLENLREQIPPQFVSSLVHGLYKCPMDSDDYVRLFRRWGFSGTTITDDLCIVNPCPDRGRSGVISFVNSCITRSIELIRRLLVSLEALEFAPHLSIRHLKEMFGNWVLLFLSQRAEKKWKWITTSLFAKAAFQEAPPREDWIRTRPVLGPGPLYRISLRISHSSLRKAWHFLKFKNFFPSVDEFFLEKAVKDHQMLLKERDCPDEELFDELCSQVLRTVREIIPQRSEVSNFPFLLPSCGGSFEASRSSGGPIHFLGSLMSDRAPTSLGNWVFEGMSLVDGRCVSHYLPMVDPDEFISIVASLPEKMDARPATVSEPCKARIVTTGPVKAYYLLRPVQRVFHSCLREHPTFRLIGRPCDEELITKTFARALEPDEVFVSADYKSSTDYLDPMLSDLAGQEMARRLGLPWELFPRIIASLTRHRLFYDNDQLIGEQAWGQLMGSVTSFPVLCVVNAALCRYAIERSRPDLGRILLKDCPLLVNGDDAAFVLKKDFYSDWKTIVTTAGLIPSQGKNYESRAFLTINSELYIPNVITDFFGSRCHAWFYRQPVMNPGLLMGFNAKGSRDESCGKKFQTIEGIQPSDLSSRARVLLRGFAPETQDRLMSIFIRENATVLSLVPRGMNWWIPKSLGGLGLPPTRKVAVDERIAKIASYMTSINDPEQFRYVSSVIAQRSESPEVLARALSLARGLGHTLSWKDPAGSEEDADPIRILVGWAFLVHDWNESPEEKPKRWSPQALFDRLFKKAQKTRLEPMKIENMLSYTDRSVDVKGGFLPRALRVSCRLGFPMAGP